MAGFTGLKHAYNARDAAARAIQALDADLSTPAQAKALPLAKLIDAFDTACERIRIMRGKPLPGTTRTKRPAAKDNKVPIHRPPAEPMPPTSQVEPVSIKTETPSDEPDEADVNADGHRTPAGLPASDSAPLLDGDSEG